MNSSLMKMQMNESRVTIELEPLSDEDAAELVMYYTSRSLDQWDFWTDRLHFEKQDSQIFSAKQQLMQERVILKCKGLPLYLREVANLLSKGNMLRDI